MPLIRLARNHFRQYLKSTTFQSIDSTHNLKELVNSLHAFFRDNELQYEKQEEDQLKPAFATASSLFFKKVTLRGDQFNHIKSSLGISFNDQSDLIKKLQNGQFQYPIEMGLRALIGVINFNEIKLSEGDLDSIHNELKPLILFADKKLYELDED